jgi:hypothetical protein
MAASMIGLSEALFVTGAAVVTIVPRTSSSSDWIGGDLAAPFRKWLLILAVMNVFRNTCFEDRRFRQSMTTTDSDHLLSEESIWTILYYVLTGAESFGLCFLMLLMPYLLQRRLSDVINIVPGRDLMTWLRAILLLNVIGIIAARYHPNFWAFKRLDDAIGCIPVITTLRLFRRVGSKGAERGNQMTIKTLEVLEFYSFSITTLAAAAYLFDDHHSTLNVAIRVGSIFVSWTRAIFHGHLLNVMDDASYIPPPPPPDPSNSEDSVHFEDIDETMTLTLTKR